MEQVTALLVLYPRGRHFYRDFPWLKRAIRSDFEAKIPPPISALRIAGSIIEDIVRQLSDAEKAAALKMMVETGRSGFGRIAVERIETRGKKGSKDRVQFVVSLAGSAIFIAVRMAEEARFRFDDLSGFVSRIEAALGATEKQPLANAFTG